MGTMPSRTGNAMDASLAAQVYADTLGNFPAAEVNATLRRFRLGGIGDGKWAPTPAEVRQAIVDARTARRAAEKREREVAEQIAERGRRKAQFEGRSPEECARVRAMAAEFAAAAAPREVKGNPETEEQFWSRMNSPVSLSPELAQSLGITGSSE